VDGERTSGSSRALQSAARAVVSLSLSKEREESHGDASTAESSLHFGLGMVSAGAASAEWAAECGGFDCCSGAISI